MPESGAAPRRSGWGVRIVAAVVWMLCLAPAGCGRSGARASGAARVVRESLVLRDGERGRDVPVELYLGRRPGPPGEGQGLVIISAGYGLAKDAYSFIAHPLAERGYLVASVQHDLPGDEPLVRTGDLFELRRPAWQRGAQNIVFVTNALNAKYGPLGGTVTLIGHSHGGDISLWLATERPEMVARVITLDHRRVPVPRVATPRIMTLRASDTTADPGVLPSPQEREALRIRVIELAGARHNDMHDGGSKALKGQILNAILGFVARGTR
jgi:pimeloyl-ACP methyl ester carboxylesterase